MSKAYLVMDMPSSCEDCKLKSRVHEIANATHCCNLAEEMITLDKGFKERLANCPLRELPQKKECIDLDAIEELGTTKEEIARGIIKGFLIEGYNTCIDEIMRGSEENG